MSAHSAGGLPEPPLGRESNESGVALRDLGSLPLEFCNNRDTHKTSAERWEFKFWLGHHCFSNVYIVLLSKFIINTHQVTARHESEAHHTTRSSFGF